MMADDQALQGPSIHLAPGSRGRAQAIAPYEPHGFTGYEPNRPTSMPSTSKRLGEAPGPPRVECFQKLFASIQEMKKPLGGGLSVSSKRLSTLHINKNNKE